MIKVIVEQTVTNPDATSRTFRNFLFCTVFLQFIYEDESRQFSYKLKPGEKLKTWTDWEGNTVETTVIDIDLHTGRIGPTFGFTESMKNACVFSGILTGA
jgi:hypothetical protein